MADNDGKENIADGLFALQDAQTDAPLAEKPTKRSRSLSLGPGALDVPLKEDAGNRRKSAFVPAVRSILSSKEDEAKRREERRKTLANRRVSFAPEATLHTWDVIEYLKDATTSSSASSESTRRASTVNQTPPKPSPQRAPAIPQPSGDDGEPPSTPPEQVEEPQPKQSPANQREMHQKKRRRSSGGDVVSSSPYQDSSPTGSDPVEIEDSLDGSEDTAMSLDKDDATVQSLQSVGSDDDSTSSSARLDEALRQAAVHAGTQGIDFDENGEASMEMAEDEITNAFKPFVQKNKRDSLGLPKLTAMRDQENENPFSPAFKAAAVSRLSDQFHPGDNDTQEMSMDITQAVGGILKNNSGSGGPAEQKNLKRRRSSTNLGSTANAEGSPAKRQSLSRRSSLRNRRSTGEDTTRDDETMDFTMVVGGIQPPFAKHAENKRQSFDTSFGEETMEFTMVVGGIKADNASSSAKVDAGRAQDDADEDMSMELTQTFDKTIKINAPKTSPGKPASPAKIPQSPAKSPIKSILRSPAKGPQTPTKSSMAKISTPTKPSTPQTAQSKPVTPQKPPKKSPRKSLAPIGTSSDLPLDSIAASTPKFLSSEESNHAEERLVNMSSPGKRLRVAAPPPEDVTAPLPPIPSPVIRESNVHFSPLPKSPQKQAAKVSTISDSIKLMSTPRKQANGSPAKRLATSTPKKAATPRKANTPRRATPRKQVRLDFVLPSADEEDASKDAQASDEVEEEDVERISLQDFLNLTNIRFMDLTTTKRRHTGHPGATATQLEEDDDVTAEQPTLENNVAVALAVLPMLSMYQHSCHEMKNYISGGREEIRLLEQQSYESQPPLFREYLAAPVEEQAIMRSHFANMKTNARLQSKSGWHSWRGQLLNDLKSGLEQSAAELAMDDATLKEQESLLASVLPGLVERDEVLATVAEQLQRRVAEMDSVDREELEGTRERLVAAEREIEEKRQLLAEMQRELEERDTHIEAVRESKEECLAQIKEAERVREECRGWSAGEVEAAKQRLHAFEEQHSWTVTAASSNPPTLTLSYKNDLSLFLHPLAFRSGDASSHAPNAPISLSYIGDDASVSTSNTKARPLTTTKRFFLQALRAHLHSLVQSQTTLSSLLNLISYGWNAALAVTEAVRCLDQVCITNETILSDERMAVEAAIILPSVQTKVRTRFGIGVSFASDAVTVGISTVEAKVVYGERYDEAKMGEFLRQFVGSGDLASLTGEETGRWAEGVEELRGRLLKRGKKGERV